MPSQRALMKNILIFCGTSSGNKPIYAEHAKTLGAALGQGGYDIIRGSGDLGLMGVVSDAARRSGSKIRGILPQSFNTGALSICPDAGQEAVETVPERKARLLALADAVIVLPGGIDTFDDLWEAVADQDIKTRIRPDAAIRPVIVLNTNGYFENMRRQFEKAQDEGFVRPQGGKPLQFAPIPEKVMTILDTYRRSGANVAHEFGDNHPVLSAAPVLLKHETFSHSG